MSLGLAAVVAAGIALPHLLRLERAAPVPALALWLGSLALRALTVTIVVLYLVAFLPRAELFHALTHWCWHTVLPLLTAEFGLEGHRVGGAATIVPSSLLVLSLVSVGAGGVRATRSINRLITRKMLGSGPGDSVIVGGADVLMAAAGFIRPRIVISAGALVTLDEDELCAGLDHERGHIAHRHRYIQATARLCFTLGRVVPGARGALAQVTFHLERDADRWALRRTNDPYALAGAIYKAATARAAMAPGLTALATAGVVERLDQLLDDEPPSWNGRRAAAVNAIAVAVVAAVLLVAALVPPTAAAGARQLMTGEQVRHCDDPRTHAHAHS